jgi:hypothetical protein
MGIANDVKNLSEDIVTSYNARVKAMGTLIKETQTLARDTHFMLDGFSNERKEMSAKQGKELSDFMADLAKNVGNMLNGFSSERKDRAVSIKVSLKKNIRDIETYVKNKLREFSVAHAEMSAELKEDLAQYVANIVDGTCELLAGFHEERETMSAYWQAMAAAMANKKRGKPVEMEAGAKVKTAEAAVAKPKKRKPGKKAGK